jgi:tripartite-type tricarboxylate transporter receptor subunit TctC
MTRTLLRALSIGVVAATMLAAGATPPQAQSDAAKYPTKPIRVIVGFAAGGGNDIFARMITQKLQERTGWTVIVENRPDAGGRLSADYVAGQPGDGYTVLVGASGAMAIGQLIFKTGYETLKSFTPVTMIADFPLFLVVSGNHPAKTLRELVDWTKANPDKANYATSSPAFTLPTELFKMRTGAQGVGIPFKSSNEMLLGVISGNAAMAIVDPPPTIAQVQGGKLRALAVTASKRMRELPNVPTMAEAGVNHMVVGLWSGFFLPAGTPKPIVDRFAKELRTVILETDAKTKLTAMAVTPSGISPEEFAKHIAAEQKMWTGVIKTANLKLGNK